jgi:Fe-S cluster assembly scaffold protein SufB
VAQTELIEKLYESIGEPHAIADDTAHIEVHGNQVLGMHLVPGLEVKAEEREDGLTARIVVKEGSRIEKPVRICFGLIPESGVQRIGLDVNVEDGSSVGILASCTFPNAVKILHAMDAQIRIGRRAEYAYIERHVHGPRGGVEIIPRAKVILEEGARFQTDFELIRGMVGDIDIEYDAVCHAYSVLEMSARISGSGDDRIKIHEKAHLVGERARGVLLTNVAVRDRARAEILNTLIAEAPYARGHVECKEIIQGEGQASAIPVLEVRDSRAHVTHEAAIGSVDSRQLETLMSRGLREEDATDLIIEGLLTPRT